MNLPNKLTIARVLIIPFFVFFLLTDFVRYNYIIAFVLFVVAALTDALDGYIARKYDLITDLGKFLDPLADKLLVTSALVCFTEMGFVPSWLVILIISRELAMTGFRCVAASKSVVIPADRWGRLKTVFQIGGIIMVFIFIIYNDMALTAFDILLAAQICIYISAALAVISAVRYIWIHRAVLNG